MTLLSNTSQGVRIQLPIHYPASMLFHKLSLHGSQSCKILMRLTQLSLHCYKTRKMVSLIASFSVFGMASYFTRIDWCCLHLILSNKRLLKHYTQGPQGAHSGYHQTHHRVSRDFFLDSTKRYSPHFYREVFYKPRNAVGYSPT